MISAQRTRQREGSSERLQGGGSCREVTHMCVLREWNHWGLELKEMDDLKARRSQMIIRVKGPKSRKMVKIEGFTESKVD